MLGAASVAGCSSPTLFDGPLVSASQQRTTTLIVPGPAASRSGHAGRIVAEALSKQLRAPVTVVNTDTPQQGYALLAAALPDGRTLGLVGADVTLLHWRGLSAQTPGSFTPLALLSEDPAGIHVRADAHWTSARQLTNAMGANPGKYKVSGAGQGAIWHMSTVRWVQASGRGAGSLTWIPSTNPATAAEELVLGGPDIVVCSVPEIRTTPLRRQIKTLAIMSGRRNPRYPDVSALSETSPPTRAGFWRGVCGPDGMSRTVANRMTAALRAAYSDATLSRQMYRKGFARTWTEGEAFGTFMAREDAIMRMSLRRSGVIAA